MPLDSHEARLVHAIGQALFLREGPVPLDGDDAGIQARVDAWYDTLPPGGRTRFSLLLKAFDKSYGLAEGNPARGFLDGSFAERVAFIEQCSTRSDYLSRQAWETLRMTMLLAYVESPAVLKATGIAWPADRSGCGTQP